MSFEKVLCLSSSKEIMTPSPKSSNNVKSKRTKVDKLLDCEKPTAEEKMQGIF